MSISEALDLVEAFLFQLVSHGVDHLFDNLCLVLKQVQVITTYIMRSGYNGVNTLVILLRLPISPWGLSKLPLNTPRRYITTSLPGIRLKSKPLAVYNLLQKYSE